MNLKYFKYIFAVCLIFFSIEHSFTQSDKEIFNNFIKTLNINDAKNKNIGDLVAEIAKSFIDKPYIGGTLDAGYIADKSFSEKLIYKLDRFDCVTLCETALSLARAIKSGNLSQENFEKELIGIRYRNGKIIGYASRLHYTSEWVADNAARNNIEDLSQKFGGKAFNTKVFFMSQNPQYYDALKNDNSLISKIAENENKINQSKRYYIPTNEVIKAVPEIHTGDIISIATNKAGLDYSHLGIAYRTVDNKLHFLHASSNQKKVTLDDELVKYLQKSKSAIGISVLRPVWKIK